MQPIIRALVLAVLAFSLVDLGMKAYCHNASMDAGFDGLQPASTLQDSVARFYYGRADRLVTAVRYVALAGLVLIWMMRLSIIRRHERIIGWVLPLLASVCLAASFLLRPTLWTALYHPL